MQIHTVSVARDCAMFCKGRQGDGQAACAILILALKFSTRLAFHTIKILQLVKQIFGMTLGHNYFKKDERNSFNYNK